MIRNRALFVIFATLPLFGSFANGAEHLTHAPNAGLTTYTVTPTGTLNVTEITPQEHHQVSILSDVATAYNNTPDELHKNIALQNVKIAVDADNVTLKSIINDIVQQAAEHTGPWHVKWRLKPENTHIPNQRVNLIAEAGFDEFIYHLTERVRNMTGTQIFINNFNTARVIVISDTYY